MSDLPPIVSGSSAGLPMPAEESRTSGGKTDYTIGSKEFRDKNNALIVAFRNILKIAESVYATNKGGKVTFPDGTSIGRKELNSLVAAFANEMETMGKHFTASVGRGKRAHKRTVGAGRGAQLKSLFYISDQMVGYLGAANYGNGLAAAFVYDDPSRTDELQRMNGHIPNDGDNSAAILSRAGMTASQVLARLQAAEAAAAAKEGRAPNPVGDVNMSDVDVTQTLDLVLNRHMATSGILISLLALITTVGDLQSKQNGQRIHYDETMVAYFDRGTNTRWILNGADLTPAGVPAGVKNAADFEKKLFVFNKDSNGNPTTRGSGYEVDKSAFQRLRERPLTSIKRTGGAVMVQPFITGQAGVHTEQNDDWGLLHSMYMVIISYFRIPNELLSPAQLGQIKSSIKGAGSPFANRFIKLVETKDQGLVAVQSDSKGGELVDSAGNMVPTGDPVPEDGKAGQVIEVESNQNIIDAAALQNYIHGLLQVHHERTEPAKKVQRDRRRREAAAAKKAKEGGSSKKATSAGSAVPPLPVPTF